MTWVKVLLRQYRWALVLVAGLPGVLTALAAPMYASTYPTAQARAQAVAAARANGALTVLYGTLAGDGTPAQMAVWELGALTTVMLAVTALLLGIRFTRGIEEDGYVEQGRGCGLPPGTPVRVALSVLLTAALLAGAGAGAGLQVLSGVTGGDALAYGLVVAATVGCGAVTGTLLGQLWTTAAAARTAGALVLAGWFALRATADTNGADSGSGWWRWLSPLGLRALVEPAAGNRALPLVVAAVACLVAGWVSLVAAARRDLGAGSIAARPTGDRRLIVRSPFGLDARLSAGTVRGWTLGLAVLGVTFAATGTSVVRSAREGAVGGGVLGTALANGDPGVAFLAYLGVIAGLLTGCLAVMLTTRLARDEASGLVAVVRATGAPRHVPLAARWLVAVVAAAVALGAATLGAAAVAPSLGASAGDAVRLIAGQWPAVFALAGAAALAVGGRPGWAPVAWLPIAGAGVVALLGALLGLPRWLIDAGPYAHAGQSGSWWLLAAGAGCAAVGLAAAARRDLTG